MDIGLRPLVLMFLICGSYLFAGSLRKETESGEPKISPVRFLIFAIVSGAIYAGGMAAADFLADETMLHEEHLDAFSLALYGTVFGLIFATGALVYSSRKFLRSFKLRTVRNTSIYGVLLASFFSFIYFLFIFDRASARPVILFFSAGFLGGAVWGAIEMRTSKKRIVGDKMIVPTPFSDRWTREVRKSFPIMMIVVGVSLLLSRMVFDSKDAWMGLLAGLFLGMTARSLIWVLLYEKRNNVRLVCEYSENDQSDVKE
jgi:hypothetical protein